MNHTQGRWKVTRAQGMPVIATESNPFIYFVSVADWQETPEYEANAYRIVACVNAFDGIEDPQKMRDTWEATKHLELDAYDKTKQELDEANNNLTLLRKELEVVTEQLTELKILCYANLQLMDQEDADEFEAEIEAICGSTKEKKTENSQQLPIPEIGSTFETVVTNEAGEEIPVIFERITLERLIEIADFYWEAPFGHFRMKIPIFIVDANAKNYFGLFRAMEDSQIIIESFNEDANMVRVESSICEFIAVKNGIQ